MVSLSFAARFGCVAVLAALSGAFVSAEAHHVIGEDRTGPMLTMEMDAKAAKEVAPKGVKAMYPTREEAEAAAPAFGCKGAHQMGQQWMPCATHHDGAGHAGH